MILFLLGLLLGALIVAAVHLVRALRARRVAQLVSDTPIHDLLLSEYAAAGRDLP